MGQTSKVKFTPDERYSASKVIDELRKFFPATEIATKIQIPRYYVHFAHSMTIRPGKTDNYLCPRWAIKKIMDFGATMKKAYPDACW